MGIRGLNSLLDKFDCIRNFKKIPRNINVIAIDANLYLCKYLYSQNVEVLYSILNQVLKFLSSNITPIYIFDGEAPTEKLNTIKKRKIKKKNILSKIQILKKQLLTTQDNRESILKKIKHLEKLCTTISSDLINNVKILLNILHIQYFDSIGEADYTCCKLSNLNLVNACLTEDMDFLLLGSDIIINFKKKGIVNYLDRNIILNNLNLTNEQFKELCIILGSDYHNFKIKLKPIDAYNSIKKYSNINNWLLDCDNELIKNYLTNCLNIKKFINETYNNTIIPKVVNNTGIIDLDNLILFFDNKINENSFPYHRANTVKNIIHEINMKYI